MSPSISLITTTYNRALFLPFTLDSILAQTHPHFELLIWDDGSTDHTLDIAHQYAQRDPRIRVIATAHQGFPRAIKGAIAATTGTYFGWVDSDDLLAPTALAETVAILDTQPQVGLVYTNHILIDEHGHDLGLGRQCRIPYHKDRLLVDFMIMHFRLLRRSVYEQVGGIDPTIEFAEDYDLCLKLSEVTDIYHLPQPLYYYRRHTGNVTNRQVDTIRSAHQAITHALQRRGLDQHYHLHVTPTFALRPKSSVQTLPTPPLAPLAPATLEPLVSIIIPAYNAAPRLCFCLQSVLQQTYPNLEIILVDNGSTDDTIAIAQSVAATSSRPFQILHCPPRGANHARNLGCTHAQGDYIQWLDADDDLAPDKITRQVIALVQQPDADIAYGDWDWCFWQDRQLIAQLRFADRAYNDFTLQTLLDNWRPPHAYLLRRRAALRLHQLQAWHPDTTVYMDREYFTLAALLGLHFLHVPDSFVCYHRWSTTQVSRRATYPDRVHNRRQIFRRLQDVAQVCQGDKLTRSHLFLLQQNWELWQPNFTLIQQADATFALQHHQHPETLPLTWQEANIARALLMVATPRTLEDHARKVMQLLWLELLTEQQQTATALDYDAIADQLAWRIGCGNNHPAPGWTKLPREPKQSLDATTLHPLLQEVPLFTPLLGEERLAVQQWLDRLRQSGWLERRVAQPTAERTALHTVKLNEYTPWALAPAALTWLAQFIRTHHIQSVVEVGSGQSTLCLAALQRDGVIQRSLSIEHDYHWYNDVRQRLQQQSLLPYSQVQLCPLQPFEWQGTVAQWYDIQSLAAFPADLVLIDGPPGHGNLLTRQPALQRLQPFIKAGTWVVLDDYQRPAEQATVQRWLQAFPRLKLVESVLIDTGLALLQFR